MRMRTRMRMRMVIEYKMRLTICNVLKSSANDTLNLSSIHSVN